MPESAESVANATAAPAHYRTQFTGENEWYTPIEYIEAARKAMGGLDLDAASSEHAQLVIKAPRFFSLENDALGQEWVGRVWLNPPFAQPLIEQFIDKLLAEYEAHRLSDAVLLTHNYTDTVWFHKAAARAEKICFTRGRIRFVNKEGVLAAPTQGQAFFYFGSRRVASFVQAFLPYGFIR
jgi:phage N-6-adenine-methyltransferase